MGEETFLQKVRRIGGALVGKQDKSYDQLAEAVRGAWDETYNQPPAFGPSLRSWVNEVYTDHVIVCAGDEYISVPYSLQDTEGDGVADDPVFDLTAAQEVERTWTPVGKDGGLILKSDDVLQCVFGWASVPLRKDGTPIIDTQKDEISPDNLELAAYEFVLRDRVGDEMHAGGVQAHLIESIVYTPEKIEALATTVKTDGTREVDQDALSVLKRLIPPGGWWTGWFLPDAEVYAKTQPGPNGEPPQYAMFSIAGSGFREEVEDVA